MSAALERRVLEAEGAVNTLIAESADQKKMLKEVTETLSGLVISVNNLASQPPPPSPRPRRSPSPDDAPKSKNSKVLAIKPEPFDGTNFKEFIRSVHLYIEANEDSFSSSKSKILFTLSLMRGGTAGGWAQNYIDQRSELGYLDLDDASWTKFQSALLQTFLSPFEAREARKKLQNMRPLFNERAADFFVRFEIEMNKAGFASGHDDLLLDYLHAHIHDHVRDAMALMAELPNTYKGFKAIAQRIDYNYRETHRPRQAAPPPRQAPPARLPPPPVRFNPPPGPPPRANPYSSERRDPTGVTFGGRGQPMEVDRARAEGRCFHCGNKGHIARQCPNRQASIRSQFIDLSDEDRVELLRALGTLKESEIQEFEEREEENADDNASGFADPQQ